MNSHDGIISAHVDSAIVQQEVVSNPAELSQGNGVRKADRFVRDVAAGHYQRLFETSQEKLMQRRIRQHEAEVVNSRSYGGGDPTVFPSLQQHNRSLQRAQQRCFGNSNIAVFADYIQRGRH